MAIPPLTLPLVAELYGISEVTLRSYVASGLIAPMRAGDNIYFTKKDRIRTEVILKGLELGFSLVELKAIINAHLPNAYTPILNEDQIAKQVKQFEDEKAALQAAIDRLNARSVEDQEDPS